MVPPTLSFVKGEKHQQTKFPVWYNSKNNNNNYILLLAIS